MTTLTPSSAALYTCPNCEQPATTGTLQIEDRGPHQTITVRTLTCPAGHTWTEQNDGG